MQASATKPSLQSHKMLAEALCTHLITKFLFQAWATKAPPVLG